MKIDIFNHIFPKKYFDNYIDAGHGGKDIGKRVSNIQTLVDVDSRFRILDEFGDYLQVITLPLPPVEILAGPDQSPELARVGNDGLAELVKKHDRFLGFAASLPMNNPKAAEKEMTRALDDLGAFGIQVDQLVILAHGVSASLEKKFNGRLARQGCANNAVWRRR